VSCRWGFVGTGGIARTMSEALALSSGGVLGAVASRTQERADDFARLHGADRAYGGPRAVEEMLASGAVDAVYVATTHPQHHTPARAALLAGVPVLVEKPMTVTLAAARDLVEASRASRTFLMEAYWTRMLPGTAALMEVLASGAVGEVQSLHADFGFAFGDDATRFHDPSIGGGSLLDLGPYPVGLAVLLLGAAEEVRAVGSLTPAGVDRQIAVAARFAGGAVASLSTTMVAHAASRAWIEGSLGTIELDRFLPTAAGFTVSTQRDGTTHEVRHDHPVEHGHRLMLDHVHDCLERGLAESPLVSHQWTLDVASILEEALTQVGVVRNEELIGQG